MTPKRRNELAGLCLVLVTLALYWPATTHDYIAFDDDQYASQNAHVMGGLSLAGIRWAFTTTYTANWHPVTWISLMLDSSVFGTFAGGHHLTNVMLHAANTLLLFVLLLRMTKLAGPSLVVAALFGWHPAHVESVAWIAERKDVLSTLFFMLTLMAYERYSTELKIQNGKCKIYYVVAVIFFAFGLMAKPMLVTLPFVLLLLDYWPLGRIYDLRITIYGSKAGKPGWKTIIIEKTPFFALAFVACAATIRAQGTGAIRTVADVPFGLRLLNALTAYTKYIGEAFWPAKLSIFYLLPGEVGKIAAIGAGLLLLAISCAAIVLRARAPWLIVGWLWFLGTLVPVIGLVQVGSQAMADRYTYIPFIGLFVAVVWTADWLLKTLSVPRIAGAALTAIVLLPCLLLTYRQVAFWQNNLTLFGHAVDVTPDNFLVQFEFGSALDDAGHPDEAIQHFSACMRLNPDYELGHYRLGVAFTEAGKLDEAADQFNGALARDPNSELLHNDLGVVYAHQGRTDAAIGEFKRAIQINPNYSPGYVGYGDALQKKGQYEAALTSYNRARELEPDSPQVLDKLALLLAMCPDAKLRNLPVALQLAQHASELTQNQSPQCLSALATVNAATGNFSNAVAVAGLARDRAKALQMTNEVAEMERDLAAYRQNRMPEPAASR